MSEEFDVAAALERIFDADTGIYGSRGFQRRVGFGARPALVHIDLANAWTRPGHAFSCDGHGDDHPGRAAAERCRAREGNPDRLHDHRLPGRGRAPTPTWACGCARSRSSSCSSGRRTVAIDDRIAPAPGELVIVKKRASGFHGTNLTSYLNAHGVDTVIITGVTMAGCVRHTAEDAIAEGFRPIVVRDAVGDRVPGVVEWNLFDIDAKFGDVEPLGRVLEYLDGMEPFVSRVDVEAPAAAVRLKPDPTRAWPRARTAARASSSETTSPYFASMSNRFASWAAWLRSPTASRGTIGR